MSKLLVYILKKWNDHHQFYHWINRYMNNQKANFINLIKKGQREIFCIKKYIQ